MRCMDDNDRKFFGDHFHEIAERMEDIGLARGNNWRIETPTGRVFRFRCVSSYAKKGSEAEQKDIEQLRNGSWEEILEDLNG